MINPLNWPLHNRNVTLHQIVLDGVMRDLNNGQIRFETNFIATDAMIQFYREAVNLKMELANDKSR